MSNLSCANNEKKSTGASFSMKHENRESIFRMAHEFAPDVRKRSIFRQVSLSRDEGNLRASVAQEKKNNAAFVPLRELFLMVINTFAVTRKSLKARRLRGDVIACEEKE